MKRQQLVKFVFPVLILWLILTACSPPAVPAIGSPTPTRAAIATSTPMAAMVTASARRPTPTDEPFPPRAPPLRLRLRLYDRSFEEIRALEDDLSDILRGLHLDIVLDFAESPATYLEQFIEESDAGVPPDLIELSNNDIAYLLDEMDNGFPNRLVGLVDMNPELLSSAVVSDSIAYSTAWRSSCGGVGLAIPQEANYYRDALNVVSVLAVQETEPCPLNSPTEFLSIPAHEDWIPYPPGEPDRNVIGDAILVPGDLVIRDGIRKLENILESENATVNTARSVLLSDEQGRVRIAPIWNSREPTESDDVIIGVAVFEDNGPEPGIPPGAYAIRSAQQQVVLESPDGERIHSEMIGKTVNPFGDPTTAIFWGSKNCRCCLFGWCFIFRCG